MNNEFVRFVSFCFFAMLMVLTVIGSSFLLSNCGSMKGESIPEKSVDVWLDEMNIAASGRNCINEYPVQTSQCSVNTSNGLISLICRNDGTGCYIRPAHHE